ncbi:hypothetical protein [Nocardiopsis sp. CNR-923]|uniref:hypothetical protein n=1 Tax=Nocardiopsis sp. CNR-923 TaxID=1904965 RepID=UPI00096AB666|nr:hypothetical protein [Nocardiopsis sp. CNR-923]
MRVLHGVWVGDALAVWAERARSVAAASGPGPAAAPRAHPFALSAGELRSLLGALGAGPTASGAAADTLRLTLPGDDRAPARSDSAGSGGAAARLLSWRVPALVLDAYRAESLLDALAGPGDGRVRLGPALAHLGAVRDFAEHLVATGCVLPDLVATRLGRAGGPPRSRTPRPTCRRSPAPFRPRPAPTFPRTAPTRWPARACSLLWSCSPTPSPAA